MAGRQRPIPILHMTVFPIGGGLGRAPRMLLEGIDKAVSSVRFPGIDIVLDQARSFETRQDSVPFVLEGGELTDICALGLATRDALRVKGYSIPARVGYAPHLTVAYSRRRSPRITFEPFGWKARDFQLIESWVDQTKYVQLAEWSLWGDPDEIETTANDGAD
ncbi:MAG: hypothetical protein GC155_18415 [Alphaproteobacteria bacterium]|nr:hypothetical protein [Alphaproteobacteria bacterium]